MFDITLVKLVRQNQCTNLSQNINPFVEHLQYIVAPKPLYKLFMKTYDSYSAIFCPFSSPGAMADA